MNILPKVKKGFASILSKSEQVRKTALGVALGTALISATGLAPADASADQGVTNLGTTAVLLAHPGGMDQAGYHYSHRSHSSHSSHSSHYSHYSSRW
jgi:hypothetical protein